MNPTTTTIVLSLLISCLFLLIGAWALVHGGTRKPAPKPSPRKQMGDVLTTYGADVTTEGMRISEPHRYEIPCPDCKYGEPCEKCLGVVQ
jgi:hypothetical protein